MSISNSVTDNSKRIINASKTDDMDRVINDFKKIYLMVFIGKYILTMSGHKPTDLQALMFVYLFIDPILYK